MSTLSGSTPDHSISSAENDALLIEYGYEPVVVDNNKAARGEGWSTRPNTVEAVAAERAACPNARNTGLRTGRTVGLDIDLRNAEHVAEIAKLAEKVLGTTGFVRFGSKGEMAVYRNATPIKKITASTDEGVAVEILGKGQQFVAYGMHPSGVLYRWKHADLSLEPLSAPLEAVPQVTPEKLRDFARQCVELLTRLGYRGAHVTGDMGEKVKPAAPSQAKGEPVSVKELLRVLKYLNPNADRPEWRDDIAAIRATPGIEVETLREIALRFSRGRYHGRVEPEKYKGDEPVNAVFNSMEPKEGGIAYGSLKKKARGKGWRDDPRTAEEAFKGYLEKPKAKEQDNDPQKPKDEQTSRVDFYRGWTPSQGAARKPIVFLDPEKLLPLTDDGAVLLWYGLRSALKTTTAVCTLMAAIKQHIDDPDNAPAVRVAYGIGEGIHSFDIGQVPAAANHFGIKLDVLDKYWRTTPVAPLTNDAEVKAYIEAHATMFDGRPPTVVVIDTMATAAQGVDENGAEIGGLLLSTGPVGTIKERLGGPLVMILDHAGKEAGRGVRGHSSKEGNADAIVLFEFDKSTRRHTGTVEKMRGAEDGFVIEYHVTPPGQVPVVTPIGRVDAQQASARKQATSLARSVLHCLSWFSEWKRGEKVKIATGDLATALVRSKAWTDPEAPGAAAPEIVLQAPLSEEERETRRKVQNDLGRLARRWSQKSDFKEIVAKDDTSDDWLFKAHAAARLLKALTDEGKKP